MKKRLRKVASVILGVLVVGMAFTPKQAEASACCIFCICSCDCSCPVGQTCYSVAGVFSAQCWCISQDFIGIPPGAPALLDTAAQFSAWLVTYGTTEMETLSADVNAQIEAISESDDTAFSNAAFAFDRHYHALSKTEKTAIQTTWGLYAD